MHDPDRKPGATVSDSTTASIQSAFRPAHSGRKGSKKVRTGCITCKIRKVKCDEAQPFCQRCTKTGRRCDGYLPSLKRQRSSGLTGKRPGGPEPHGSLNVFYDWASADEVRSFQFFQHVTAPCLSGDFDGAFWRVLVLQICQTEPAVKHAVLAVSSLHEGMMRGMVPYADMGDRQSFALWQYNKAIAHLLDQMRYADARPLVPLLTCILFVCIEFMQSKDRESLIHLEQGRQILGQLGRKSRNPEIDIIKQHLVPVYTRLSLTSLMIGGDPMAIPTSLKTTIEIPVSFETIDEVRYTLYDFMDECLRFTKKTMPTKLCSTPPEPDEMRSFIDEQNYLLSKHARFNVAFSLYQSTKAQEAPPGSIALIQIHIHTTFIWLSTALSRRETVFDDHITSFSAIIPLATSFMDALAAPPPQIRTPPGQPPSAADTRRFSAMFAFEMHVIAPLYFVATKCRHPAIRRSALRLLQRNPARRENLWRANIMASIAEYIIQVEEQHLRLEDAHSQHSRPMSPATRGQQQFPFSFAPDNMWTSSMQEITNYIQSQPDMTEPERNFSFESAAQTPLPASCTVSPSAGMMTSTVGDVDMSGHFELPIDPSLLLDAHTPDVASSVHSFSDVRSIASSFEELSQPAIFVGNGTSGGGSATIPATSSIMSSPPPVPVTSATSPWPPYSQAPALRPAPGIMLEPPTPMAHHHPGMMMSGGLHQSPQQHQTINFSSLPPSQQHSPHMRPTSSDLDFRSVTFISEGEDDSSSYSSHSGSRRPTTFSSNNNNNSNSSSNMGPPAPGTPQVSTPSAGAAAAHQYHSSTSTTQPQYAKSRTEGPFDIPENLRVHVAIIDENDKEEGGSWVKTFRKVDGADANWTVQKQFVPVLS